MKIFRVRSRASLRRRSTVSLAIVVAITAATLLPPLAAAGVGFQPVVPEELKMTERAAGSRGTRHHLCSVR